MKMRLLESRSKMAGFSRFKLGTMILCVSFGGCSVPDVRFEALTLSPDGKYILAVYARSVDSSFLYRIPLDTGVAKRVTDVNGGFEAIPSVSPDGKRIVYSYSSNAAGHSRIIIVNSDGSNPQPVTITEGTDDYFPIMLDDNRTIIFARPKLAGHEWNVFECDLDGGGLRQLTHEDAYTVSRPSVSPDGKRIVFVNKDIERGDFIAIYSLERPPKPKATLTPHVAGEPGNPILDDASFLPDGKSILFLAASVMGGPYDYDVYKMDIQTQVIEKLTKGNGYAYSLQPSRDGSKAVFVRGALSGSGKSSEILLLDLSTRKLTSLRVTGLD
jgi:Tol biopolymer transport system component